MPKHLIVRGNHNRSLRGHLGQALPGQVSFEGFDSLPSMESQQQDLDAAVQAIKQLFVVKPRQSGLTTIAELTAQAIQNPSHTMVLWEPTEDETADEKADREALSGFLADKGVQLYSDRLDVVETHNNDTETETVASQSK